MTLEQAIKHCLEVAEEQERKAQGMGRQFVGTVMANHQNDCLECASDQRQLAEWLIELQELRCRVFADDPLIETTIEMLDTELQEAKRLLKLALTSMNGRCIVKCYNCKHKENCSTHHFEWIYTDEVLKLLGEGGEQNDT